MTNYNEDSVRTYALPDLLTLADGTPVTDAETWQQKRRPELLRLFAENVFGETPPVAEGVGFEVISGGVAFGGLATRKKIAVRIGEARFHLLLYVPTDSPKPCAAFLGLNFSGNHTVSDDPGVAPVPQWERDDAGSVAVHRLPTLERGAQASLWQVETVLKRGYALATADYEEIEPDFVGGARWGLRASLPVTGQADCGAIGIWAYALSRAMDYLETDPTVDARRVALIGHSRLGKTALWAAAQDERFALVIANNSGEGGAAISRRRFGENIADLVRNFPHWFATRYAQFADNEDALPVDAHSLLALTAPRPLYVASATEDAWADPRGEFLGAKATENVYNLFGRNGLGGIEFPAPDTPVGETVRYHLRTGKHDVTAYDWEKYLDFADAHSARR